MYSTASTFVPFVHVRVYVCSLLCIIFAFDCISAFVLSAFVKMMFRRRFSYTNLPAMSIGIIWVMIVST